MPGVIIRDYIDALSDRDIETACCTAESYVTGLTHRWKVQSLGLSRVDLTPYRCYPDLDPGQIAVIRAEVMRYDGSDYDCMVITLTREDCGDEWKISNLIY